MGLLLAITGNIDIPGGWIFGMHVVDPVTLLTEKLSEEMKERRLGAGEFKVLCGREALFPSAHVPTVFRAMRTGEPYPIKAFLIFRNNGLTTYADSQQVYETLMKLDFISVMDLYMTPTAELADIILPAATWLEVDSIVCAPVMASNIALAQKRITRLWECLSDEEVFLELAKKLNLHSGNESIEEIYDRQLRPLGITFEELKKKGFVSVPVQYRKFEETGFKTDSGKIELFSRYLERLGYDPLPHYREPPESPISTPEVAEAYPLVLTSGARSQYFFHSEYRQVPSRQDD